MHAFPRPWPQEFALRFDAEQQRFTLGRVQHAVQLKHVRVERRRPVTPPAQQASQPPSTPPDARAEAVVKRARTEPIDATQTTPAPPAPPPPVLTQPASALAEDLAMSSSGSESDF